MDNRFLACAYLPCTSSEVQAAAQCPQAGPCYLTNGISCALQHFCAFDEDGLERPEPFCPNMVEGEDGPDIAARYLRWLEDNMPGFTHARKGNQLVSPAVHACLWSTSTRHSKETQPLQVVHLQQC